jgi:PilZ domain
MASDNSSKSAAAGDESKVKGKTNQSVVEHLQAPRRKRKSFVVMATGPNIESDTVQATQRFMKTQYPKVSFVVIKSLEELVKYSNRNIILALIDDQLEDRTVTMQTIRKIKEKKTDGPMPTLFLTNNGTALVQTYKTELSHWHEVDEYIVLNESPRHALFTKIKGILDGKSQRRSRRFKISIPVSFQVLDTGEKMYEGTILDFSIHGALLSVTDDLHNFSGKDQLLIHLPIGRFVKSDTDVFRVSARIRRVLISGAKAGITWEYMSDSKSTTMTALLAAIVDQSLAKSAAATRARIAKSAIDNDMSRKNGP